MSKEVKWSNGDFFFDNDGKTRNIENEEKLAQNLAYFLLNEPILTNPRTRKFSDISLAINTAVAKLKRAQNSKTNLSDREKLANVEEIIILPKPDEPKTAAYFFVRVSTESNDVVPFLFDATTITNLSHLLPPGF